MRAYLHGSAVARPRGNARCFVDEAAVAWSSPSRRRAQFSTSTTLGAIPRSRHSATEGAGGVAAVAVVGRRRWGGGGAEPPTIFSVHSAMWFEVVRS